MHPSIGFFKTHDFSNHQPPRQIRTTVSPADYRGNTDHDYTRINICSSLVILSQSPTWFFLYFFFSIWFFALFSLLLSLMNIYRFSQREKKKDNSNFVWKLAHWAIFAFLGGYVNPICVFDDTLSNTSCQRPCPLHFHSKEYLSLFACSAKNMYQRSLVELLQHARSQSLLNNDRDGMNIDGYYSGHMLLRTVEMDNWGDYGGNEENGVM